LIGIYGCASTFHSALEAMPQVGDGLKIANAEECLSMVMGLVAGKGTDGFLASRDGMHAAVSGDFLGADSKSVAAACLEAFKSGKLKEHLSTLEFEISLVICDPANGIVILANDRFGFAPLFLLHSSGFLAWAPALHMLMSIPGQPLTIDIAAAEDFLSNGHMIGNRSWFNEISCLPPATLAYFDTRNGRFQQERYWSWSEIGGSEISFDEAAKHLGELLHKSVKKRYREGTGVSLSGGLDSRMMVAAVREIDPGYSGFSYTFGNGECFDVKIARQVADTAGWRHKVFAFNDHQWLRKRLDKIRHFDGMCSVKHMHDLEFNEIVSSEMDRNLNGFLGDAVAGGSYLERVPELDSRIDFDTARSIYGRNVSREYVEDPYFNAPHADVFLFANRGRRFINYGMSAALSQLGQARPFFDVELVSFLMSLPDSFRQDNRLYGTALVRRYPDFFRTIPWQKTGLPVGQGTKPSLGDRLKRKLKTLAGIPTPTQGFVHYDEWIRTSASQEIIRDLLCGSTPKLASFVDPDVLSSIVDEHMSGAVTHDEQILRWVTAETFFQQMQT